MAEHKQREAGAMSQATIPCLAHTRPNGCRGMFELPVRGLNTASEMASSIVIAVDGFCMIHFGSQDAAPKAIPS